MSEYMSINILYAATYVIAGCILYISLWATGDMGELSDLDTKYLVYLIVFVLCISIWPILVVILGHHYYTDWKIRREIEKEKDSNDS